MQVCTRFISVVDFIQSKKLKYYQSIRLQIILKSGGEFDGSNYIQLH